MSKDDFQKHTLFLYRGDYARLQALDRDTPAAVVIRKLVRNYLKEHMP